MLIMIRAISLILYLGLYLIYSLFILVKVTYYHRKNRIEERDQLIFRTVKKWAKSMVSFGGAKVKVIGQENIPKEGAVLFVGNHQSNFDIPILLGFVDYPKGFIAKIELLKVPILSTWMQYMKCIFIDRRDIRQSLRAINQGVNYLKDGYSLVIFPEGTRSVNGELGDFKPGSLKLAIKAGVPIIPITIKDSFKLMDKSNFSIKPAAVEVIISKPFYVKHTQVKETKEMTDEVKRIIKENLK